MLNMNSVSRFASALTIATALTATAAKADLPQNWKEPDLQTVTPSLSFTPTGFDDNDHAQIVLTGMLRNTCYKIGPTQVAVDREAKKILITQQAYHYTGCWCLQMMVPYQRTVEVGVVPAGNYTVEVRNDQDVPQPLGTLGVAKANSKAPDDYLYAPVTEATVDALGGTAVVTLTGTFSSDCMSVREVKVIQRKANVIELLPIVDVREDGVCRENPTPFQARAKLDGLQFPLQGKMLIHVRSLNGQAVNKLVDF